MSFRSELYFFRAGTAVSEGPSMYWRTLNEGPLPMVEDAIVCNDENGGICTMPQEEPGMETSLLT